MKKLQQKIQKIGVVLMFVFPIGLFITLLCSDYRTETEYNQYVVISGLLVNWYTFTTTLIGMLLYTLGWVKVPQKRKRPQTF